MAESHLSANQHYIEHANGPLGVNQCTIQMITMYKLLTTTYKNVA